MKTEENLYILKNGGFLKIVISERVPQDIVPH
jgi:hypothetical protein